MKICCNYFNCLGIAPLCLPLFHSLALSPSHFVSFFLAHSLFRFGPSGASNYLARTIKFAPKWPARRHCTLQLVSGTPTPRTLSLSLSHSFSLSLSVSALFVATCCLLQLVGHVLSRRQQFAWATATKCAEAPPAPTPSGFLASWLPGQTGPLVVHGLCLFYNEVQLELEPRSRSSRNRSSSSRRSCSCHLNKSTMPTTS